MFEGVEREVDDERCSGGTVGHGRGSGCRDSRSSLGW